MQLTAKFRLAAVLIVKDEATYLEEWIAYHLGHGVEHFFIYDNRSTDNTTDVLERFMNHGLVTLLSFRQIGGQTDCYRHATRFFGPSAEWLTFTDVDEFFVLPGTERLVDFLARQPEDVTQVQFPWRGFTFGGHMTRPEGLVIKNFGLASEIPDGGFASIGAKPIVRPDAVKAVYVHVCQMARGRTVDPGGRTIEPSAHMVRPEYSSGQLNHYYSRSVEEFRKKIERGQVDGGKEKGFYMPSPQQIVAGIPDPISEYWIRLTEENLRYWNSLSVNPNGFGSHLRGHHMHNITQYKFDLTIGHYLADTKNLSVKRLPLKYTKAIWGSVAIDTERTNFDLSDFVLSIHFQDFLRQTRSKLLHGGSNATNTHAFTVPSGTLMHKIAILAVIPTTPPATCIENTPSSARILKGDIKTGGASSLSFTMDISSSETDIVAFRYFHDHYFSTEAKDIHIEITYGIISSFVIIIQE